MHSPTQANVTSSHIRTPPGILLPGTSTISIPIGGDPPP